MNSFKKLIVLFLSLNMLSCSIANRASYDLEKATSSFKVPISITIFNISTNKIINVIVGYCYIEDFGYLMTITCKDSSNTYSKYKIAKGNDISYFTDQLEPYEIRLED